MKLITQNNNETPLIKALSCGQQLKGRLLIVEPVVTGCPVPFLVALVARFGYASNGSLQTLLCVCHAEVSAANAPAAKATAAPPAALAQTTPTKTSPPVKVVSISRRR